MTPEPGRRRFLRAAAAATAAVALSGGTAAASELQDGQERSDLDNTIGERVPGRRPRVARVAWSFVTDQPHVALTFDDGPDPELTPRVLDVLAAAGAKATFLMVGEHARRYPQLVHDVVAAGHEVGSHTWSHPDLSRVDPGRTTSELVDGATAVSEVAGTAVRLFRPPWGNLTGSALRVSGELGQDVLLWSHSAEHLPAHLDPGDVVLFHDGVCRGTSVLGRSSGAIRARHEEELARLPELLTRMIDRGLQFVTASELLRP